MAPLGSSQKAQRSLLPVSVEAHKAAFGVPKNVPRTRREIHSTILTKEEEEKQNCTFQPQLMSNKKLRDKASSHKYGLATVALKKPAEPEVPTFKPALDVSKSVEKRRQTATGSGYGKAAVKVKEITVPTLEFKPQLVDAGKTKELREKAQPRYLEAQKKYKEMGKEAKKDVAQKKSSRTELPKFSLYADRPVTAPASTGRSERSFDLYAPAPAEDSVGKRIVSQPPPVKATKLGAELKAKQKSRYSSDAYTPAKSERPKTAKASKWAPSVPMHKPTVGAPAEKLPKAPQSKRVQSAKSSYAQGEYTPPKVIPIDLSPRDKSWLDTSTWAGSPLDKMPDPVPKKTTANKFAKVQSSGYGVVGPEPSVPAKIHAVNHRSVNAQIRSADFRANLAISESEQKSVDGPNDENEVPNLGDDGMAQINDLIEKAAVLDPGHAPPCAAVPFENAASAEPVEQLTVL
mmetsp:Transcript_8679/g.26049  ORF Transcript_8679/g.26049 Transcript_8679/m.26049 type:complete len:460 (-) Transcript_8679:135-1514(-)